VNNPTPDRYQPFAHFMQAYQDMVFSTAARLLGNRQQAEDIVQDVFLKAYERFDQLRDSATAGGWLKTVATHLALNHLSRHRSRWRLFSELRADHTDAAVPELDWPLPDTLLDRLQDQQHHNCGAGPQQFRPAARAVGAVSFRRNVLSKLRNNYGCRWPR
jgi:RNA polymerase sigma factor (sigma-70 family)